VRKRRAHGVDDAAEVDRDDVDEAHHGSVPADGDDPGVGHHDVQPAQLGDAVADRGRQLTAVTDVGSLAIRALGDYPRVPEVEGFADAVRSRLPVA
jgi:hypothetical protein